MPFSRGITQPRDWTRVFCSPALQADSLPLSHLGSPYQSKKTQSPPQPGPRSVLRPLLCLSLQPEENMLSVTFRFL